MRILFVKTSSLGDVIHNCPAVSDVRQQFPAAEIDWVVEESFAEICALHPAVRRVIPVAVRRWRSRLFSPSVWQEIRRFRDDLRTETYDVVLDSQGLIKSALISAATRGTTHGFDAASAREPLASRFYDVRHGVPREMHAVERNRRLTAAALETTPHATCVYGLKPRDGNPISLASPYCVLFSMTSRSDKLWPEEHWVELVRALESDGLECVLPWGNSEELARCRRIVALAGYGNIPRALTLDELASVIAGARGAVGVDTGLAHLTVALDVPVVGLYLGSDPSLTGLHGGRGVANLGRPGVAPTPEEALASLRALV